MADFGRGIKAGMIAAIIESLIFAVVFFFLGETLTGWSASLWNSMGIVLVVGSVVYGIIGGIIIGIIFAALYERLPTKSSIVKAIIMGVIFWLIFGLLFGIMTEGFFLALEAVEAIFQVLVYGILLGFFWDMFGGKGKK